MLAAVDVRTVLKRGALVAAANWQVTVIQFMAESTFKMLLSVPVAGGVLLVVLVLGRELPELFSGDIRESATFVATALAAEPPALISFLLAFSIVGLAGSAFMFLLKGGTVAVLADAERDAAAVEEPPLRLEPFWTAARFSVRRYDLGCRKYFRRFLRLGFMLIVVYVASAALYLTVLLRGVEWFTGGQFGWTAVAGIGSTVLVVWVTLVNFLYLLIQMVVVVEDCSVRSATRRVGTFLRAEPALTCRGLRRGAAAGGRRHHRVGDCDHEPGPHRVCPAGRARRRAAAVAGVAVSRPGVPVPRPQRARRVPDAVPAIPGGVTR